MTVKYPRQTSEINAAPNRIRDILVIAAAVILAVTAYAGTLTHELVWDDVPVVKYIDSIVQEGGLSALVTSQFATHIEDGYVSGYYRPVIVVSLWFDSLVSGYFPFFYHLTNIILHALNTILVFVLLRLVSVRFAAGVGAMIFAVHPVHTESVSFVSGRTDLWAAFFVLLAVITWVRERKGLSTAPAHDRFRSFAAFFMACLCKETAFMLPAVLLIWEAAVPGLRQTGYSDWWTRNRRWIIGWTAVLAGVAVLRLLVFGPDLGLIQSRAGQVSTGEDLFGLAMIGQMLMGYLRLLVLPWPLKVYYGPLELGVTWTTALAVLSFISLVALVVYRGRRDVAVQAMAWIGIFLVPVLAGPRGGALMAERFLYLPSVGVCLLAGVLAADIVSNRRIVAGAVVGVMITLMMIGTIKQSAVWKDEVTLFSEHVRVAPLESSGHYNLGNALVADGRHTEAVEEYRITAAIRADHHQAYFNMANSLLHLGRSDEAVAAYREALRVEPGLVPGHINLGAAYLDAGEYDLAVDVFRGGLFYAPGDLKLNVGLIIAYLGSGDRQAAEEHSRQLDLENPELGAMVRQVLIREPGGAE